jgi:hypothetical protein
MINIKGIFQPKVGDTVIVKSNLSGNHNYQLGREYVIVNDNGHCNYLLSEIGDHTNQQHLDPRMHGLQQWITLQDLDIKVDKESLISNLGDMLEFLKDYESELTNSSKLEKEFKVFHILKEVKSEKSDFAKIEIISKYL